MSYGVVRTDNMFGTDVREGLVSVKYMGSGSTATAVENGNVVALSGLMTNEREIFKGVTPAANTPLEDLVLIASPEVMYDERKHNLDDFRNEAGAVCRGYHLHKGGIFSVTGDALTNATSNTDMAVGDVVEAQAGVKLKVKAAATGATDGSTVVGKIIEVENVGRYKYYVIKIG